MKRERRRLEHAPVVLSIFTSGLKGKPIITGILFRFNK